MISTATVFILIFAFGTVGVLVAGIIVMARGGEIDQKWSNKLMSLRVALQAIAIGLLVLFFARSARLSSSPLSRPCKTSAFTSRRFSFRVDANFTRLSPRTLDVAAT